MSGEDLFQETYSRGTRASIQCRLAGEYRAARETSQEYFSILGNVSLKSLLAAAYSCLWRKNEDKPETAAAVRRRSMCLLLGGGPRSRCTEARRRENRCGDRRET